MENKIESSMGIEGTGNYLQLFLYRVPKKNHDAIVQNLKQFVPWFKKHGASVEYYQFGNSETEAAIASAKQSGMDVMDSLDKALSTTTTTTAEVQGKEEEEVWIEQQYFRDYKHCRDVYSKMMQDKSLESLGSEFFDLITRGNKLITGGFNRLKA
ncbi:MAG: DUF1428 family protein [Thermoproteota archaeon]|nr:DUF1428 family protein [Thermoproteota archaeon]